MMPGSPSTRGAAAGLLAAGFTLLPAAAVAAGRETVAVVAGFERFGRDAARAAVRFDVVDAGRLLIGELGCTACHATDAAGLEPKGGPDLAGVGTRVEAAWLRRYLADPAAAAPGTTMPHALAAVPLAEREATIAALAAHLATRQAPVPLPKPSGMNAMPPGFWNHGDRETGATLYHRVGCVACHAAEEDRSGAVAATGPTALLDEEDLVEAGIPLPEKPFASVPLGHVAEKYSRRSLTEFLMVPTHARPAGRMPSLRLTSADAAHVAAFLQRDATAVAASAPSPTDPAPAADPALAARGRAAFTALGCVACHAGGVDPEPGGDARSATAAAPDAVAVAATVTTAPAPPPLAAVDPRRGDTCITATTAARPAPKPTHRGPRYTLDDAQRAALVAVLDDLRAETSRSRLSALDLALVRLNCVACHERDGRGGVGTDRRGFFETVDDVDLGDEGRLPPRLTGVGARLTKPWLEKAVAGSDAPQKPSSHDTSRIAWAKLMARVGEEFPLECPACGGDIRLIAFITEPGPIRKILTHLGEPLEPPPVSPARGPPTDWGELVQPHDDREAVQVSPDELPAIDIHSI